MELIAVSVFEHDRPSARGAGQREFDDILRRSCPRAAYTGPVSMRLRPVSGGEPIEEICF
jgi:hypothetical protein